MCFGSKIVETSTRQQLPEFIEKEAERITGLSRALTDQGRQYVPYGGERLAPLTTEQQLARQASIQQAGAFGPDLQRSRQFAMGAAAPITAQEIQQFQSPYTQAVLQTTLDELDRRQQIADQRLSDQAVRSGAFGGARFGVQQAESQRNLRDVQARTAADINQRAFQQALGQAQAQRQRESQAAGQFGNIAGQQMQLGSAGIQGLLQSGQLGQTQAQAGRDIAYEDFQRQQNFPFEQARFAAGILGGMPQPVTTFQQTPTAGTGQRLLGLGIAGIGAAGQAGGFSNLFGGFSDIRLKDNIKLVGKSPSNINIYTFNYKGSDDTYQGVMAQEVPWASSLHDNGYLMVDYSKTDVEFRRLA
jgi:hypothetical protein